MRTTSTILLALAGAAALAAIWAPGMWWQWLLTALVLFLAGAVLGGTAAMPKRYIKGGHIGPQQDDELTAVELRPGRIVNSTGDPDLNQNINTRPTYGKTSKENEQ